MPRFFKVPIHYQDGRQVYNTAVPRAAVSQVNDNDYRTYSEESTLIFETYGDTPIDNTHIGFIFVKSQNVTSYTVTVPTGRGSGGGVRRFIPHFVTSPSGQRVNTIIDGIQHDLLNLSTRPVVVASGDLTMSTISIEDNLSNYLREATLSINLSDATLTDPMTPGTLVINGENPIGTTVTETLSFAAGSIGTSQRTTESYLRITSIQPSGFSSGTARILSNHSNAMLASQVQIEFTGTSTRIYEVMLLEPVLNLDAALLDITWDYQHNSIQYDNIKGEDIRIRSLASRPKLRTDYQVWFRDNVTPTSYNTFMNFYKNNVRFSFAEDPNLYPDRVYPATWGSNSSSQSYISEVIPSGRLVNFTIQES